MQPHFLMLKEKSMIRRQSIERFIIIREFLVDAFINKRGRLLLPTGPDGTKVSPLSGLKSHFFRIFFNVPKGSHLEFFVNLLQIACLQIKKVLHFTFFGTVRHFSKEKLLSRLSRLFPKNDLRFLSLRYSANVRRSRLVQTSCLEVQCTDKIHKIKFTSQRCKFINCVTFRVSRFNCIII